MPLDADDARKLYDALKEAARGGTEPRAEGVAPAFIYAFTITFRTRDGRNAWVHIDERLERWAVPQLVTVYDAPPETASMLAKYVARSNHTGRSGPTRARHD